MLGAAAVLIGGGEAAGLAAAQQPAAAPAGLRHSATAPGTGPTGTVSLVTKARNTTCPGSTVVVVHGRTLLSIPV